MEETGHQTSRISRPYPLYLFQYFSRMTHQGELLLKALWQKILLIDPQERTPVLGSAAYFFFLLASYYLLRPVRDEMGIRAGVDQLQWLFTATFLVMLLAVPLFGWLSKRFPRQKLIASVYGFFIVSLLLFYPSLKNENLLATQAFYVWVSVYNLFVVSVFWSLMSDLFSRQQGKRLFSIIAIGGTLGAIAGPGIATTTSLLWGTENLLIGAAGLLFIALLLSQRLIPAVTKDAHSRPLAGGVWDGMKQVRDSRQLQGIALFIWLYTTLATILYFQQADIIANAFHDSAERTATFAAIDLAVNLLTLLLQLVISNRLIKRFGLHSALALVPAVLAVGFLALALSPSLMVLIAIQILRRSGNYGLTRPAREVLYTDVSRSERYKAKNFIDTVVYRGGDALAGWGVAALKGTGLGIAGLAWCAIPLAVLWTMVGYRLGAHFEQSLTQESTHAVRQKN